MVDLTRNCGRAGCLLSDAMAIRDSTVFGQNGFMAAYQAALSVSFK
ncbi:unnamed protein product [Mycena citricolor]|uniref:Uncharacterized protein n=1 Tax=Mycena citricolor TaxID=2018698 RepID=A0AAD2HUJ1_9AGAR|nr:unnamed protein product [Mycena citricolor]